MFPLKNTEAYIHANGDRSTLGQELATRDAAISELGSEIQALTNYVTKTGVKNLLPYPYYNTSKTASGITFTDNGDGSITLNGTATGAIDFVLFNGTALKGFSGAKLNGNPLPAAQAIIQVEQYGGRWTNYGTMAGGADTTLATIPDNDTVWIFLRVFSGATINNVTVYPMIREASITDPTYQPYAKTNVELTNLIKTMTISKTSTENGAVSVTEIRPSTHILLNAYVTNSDGRYDTLVSTPKGASSDTFIFWLCENYSTTVVTNSTVNITLVYMDK